MKLCFCITTYSLIFFVKIYITYPIAIMSTYFMHACSCTLLEKLSFIREVDSEVGSYDIDWDVQICACITYCGCILYYNN